MRLRPWVLAACVAAWATPAFAQKVVVPAGMGYTLGAAAAKVEVIQFSDLDCDSCATFMVQKWPRLDTEFITPKLVRWTFVPIRASESATADEATAAAICAGGLGDFWGALNVLSMNHEKWKTNTAKPNMEIRAVSWTLNLDYTKLEKCMAAPATAAKIKAISTFAKSVDATVPSTYFINGERVERGATYEQLRELLVKAVGTMPTGPTVAPTN